MTNINMSEKPLVSVIVITYNSSETIIETLESIKGQKYESIELIITDDCSVDDTINVCYKWIEHNKKRFSRAEVVTVDKNSGIPANCNRGLEKASGEWIKFIAGDDKLIETAISDVIKFVESNNEIEVLDSVVEIYNNDFSRRIGNYNHGAKDFYSETLSSVEQRHMFANTLFGPRLISTLGVFVKRKLLVEIGGFDERYRLLEDSPLWWKILKSGRKFYFLGKTTTCYRRHDTSVSFNREIDYSSKILSDFQLTVFTFIKENLSGETSKLNKLNILWLDIFYRIIFMLGNKGIIAERFYKLARRFQPLRIASSFKAKQ